MIADEVDTATDRAEIGATGQNGVPMRIGSAISTGIARIDRDPGALIPKATNGRTKTGHLAIPSARSATVDPAAEGAGSTEIDGPAEAAEGLIAIADPGRIATVIAVISGEEINAAAMTDADQIDPGKIETEIKAATKEITTKIKIVTETGIKTEAAKDPVSTDRASRSDPAAEAEAKILARAAALAEDPAGDRIEDRGDRRALTKASATALGKIDQTTNLAGQRTGF